MAAQVGTETETTVERLVAELRKVAERVSTLATENERQALDRSLSEVATTFEQISDRLGLTVALDAEVAAELKARLHESEARESMTLEAFMDEADISRSDLKRP